MNSTGIGVGAVGVVAGETPLEAPELQAARRYIRIMTIQEDLSKIAFIIPLLLRYLGIAVSVPRSRNSEFS